MADDLLDKIAGQKERPKRSREPAPVKAFYNGKVVDMAYVQDPKKRFSLAAYRIQDNMAEGYVLDGEKVYKISKRGGTAKLVAGDEREVVLAEVRALEEKQGR